MKGARCHKLQLWSAVHTLTHVKYGVNVKSHDIANAICSSQLFEEAYSTLCISHKIERDAKVCVQQLQHTRTYYIIVLAVNYVLVQPYVKVVAIFTHLKKTSRTFAAKMVMNWESRSSKVREILIRIVNLLWKEKREKETDESERHSLVLCPSSKDENVVNIATCSWTLAHIRGKSRKVATLN